MEEEGGEKKLVRFFLLGTALGMVMLQKGIVAVHGSAIFVNNRGLILTGERGAGKSTLTTGFIKKGYRFLSDDVSALWKNEEGRYVIHPAYPYKRLCADSLEIFGYDPEKCELIDEDRKSIQLKRMNIFTSFPFPWVQLLK